jgi:glycine cleavage system H lipoate-binding protein
MGSIVKAGQEIGEVESTKTTSAIYTPVSGKIVAVNEDLKDKPELINKEPYGHGWIARIELSNANGSRISWTLSAMSLPQRRIAVKICRSLPTTDGASVSWSGRDHSS